MLLPLWVSGELHCGLAGGLIRDASAGLSVPGGSGVEPVMPPAMLSAIMRAVHSPQAGASQAVAKRLAQRLPPLQVRRPCTIRRCMHDVSNACVIRLVIPSCKTDQCAAHSSQLCRFSPASWAPCVNHVLQASPCIL